MKNFQFVKSICILSIMLTACTTLQRADHIPREFLEINNQTKQIVLVESSKIDLIQASVSLWEYKNDTWQKTINNFPATLGRNGLASLNEKREGDGRTPSGTFTLTKAFGYQKDINTNLDYRQATANDFWIDDSSAPYYNQWVSGAIPSVSHEKLKREDYLYKYAIIIDYNADPVIPGNGSAIFMHIWRNKNAPTAGCVAASEANILKLINQLDKKLSPVIILK